MLPQFMNITAWLTSVLDTLCSQAYGAKRFAKIVLYFQVGVQIISVCLGPIYLFNWYAETFLLAMGQDAKVAQFAQSFSRWMLLGVPFGFLYELVRKVLQAQNIVKPHVVIAIILAMSSTFYAAIISRMGFHGIALARALGNVVLPLLLIPYFHS
ncbi:hypothetical protein CCR75_002352 [Bremia lactucae]|uniref:Uncharacterized protein n=1 Tax=Bremia lactucae TaxID=4779 RepID=A0A976IEW2_BRELC|nr:hypothetical protein CCR75_002352 [Bremia lactucae]